MRWRDIGRNLLDYHAPGLEQVDIAAAHEYGVMNRTDYTTYRADPSFKPAVIVVPTFGASSSPGSYNMALAMAARTAQHRYGNIPIIAQREAFDAYCRLFNGPITGICAPQRNKTFTHITTRDALIEAIAHIDADARDKILYVANPLHMFRTIKVGEKLGLYGKPFLPPVGADRFDPQLHCTAVGRFAQREIAVRVHHKLMGWV